MSGSVHTPYAAFDLVVVASSTGGIRSLRAVLAGLPDDFPAPIVIVQHLSDQWPSRLTETLSLRCRLSVSWVSDGQAVRGPGVFVAPPGHHVSIRRDGSMALSRDPRVNFVRPSADVLFCSAADYFGSRVLALVLTGNGRDGAAGAAAVKRAGGRVLVQDARTAMAFGMPAATIQSRCVDFVLPLDKIPAAVVSLVMVPGAAGLLQVDRAASQHLPDRLRAADWDACRLAGGSG